MEDFLRKLPKIELHAHLNGSLQLNSIRELGAQIYGANSDEFLKLSQQFIEFNRLDDLNDCFKKFKFMHDLTKTRKGLELATLLVIRDFASEHVIHLELRTTPKANEAMSKRDYLQCVIEAIEKAKESYPEIGVKLLPSIDRSQSVREAEETVQVLLELRQLHPRLITGIDLSGNPNCGEFKNFVPLLRQARACGLKLALHCAETDNPSEIAEMLEFGMQRCGHGTFLSEQQLTQLAREHVAIECCLTSNVKCGTVASYTDHHFRRIFGGVAEGAVVLCTDDCGVFDSNLTQELNLAVQAFGLQRQDLLRLSLNAAEHAFADEQEKQRLKEQISEYFESI